MSKLHQKKIQFIIGEQSFLLFQLCFISCRGNKKIKKKTKKRKKSDETNYILITTTAVARVAVVDSILPRYYKVKINNNNLILLRIQEYNDDGKRQQRYNEEDDEICLETNKHHAARRKTHKKAAAVVAAIDKMESIENWFISMKEYFRLKNKKKLNFMRSRMKKEKLVFGEQPGGLVDSFLREMLFLKKKQTNSLTIFSQFHH
jgi:hypothetical protein